MDKKVILAVAGSGKTTHIIESLSLDKRSLIITYTNNNLNNIRDGIIRKWGYFPNNIQLLPYFTFLHSFCYRPFLSYNLKTKGINFDKNLNTYIKQNDPRYFIDKLNRLYSNRIAKLLEVKGVLNDVNDRMSKYFDNLFIDEIQDFASCDFNFVKSIGKANIEMTLVGDFYQHTFDTSRDGSVNMNLFSDFNKYINNLSIAGFTIDTESLKKSHRCSPTVCDFIEKQMGIKIKSHKTDSTKIYDVHSDELANNVFQNNLIVKLFYQEHYRYPCYSRNWGDCKGENKYFDVCVVMNKKTYDHYKLNKLNELSEITKNKLYVAFSRARNDVYIVSDSFYKKYKNKCLHVNQ